MSKIKTGGPAYPLAVETGPDFYGRKSHKVEQGMSLRDYFAGQALASWPITEHGACPNDLARKCYALADAMIVARGH